MIEDSANIQTSKNYEKRKGKERKKKSYAEAVKKKVDEMIDMNERS